METRITSEEEIPVDCANFQASATARTSRHTSLSPYTSWLHGTQWSNCEEVKERPRRKSVIIEEILKGEEFDHNIHTEMIEEKEEENVDEEIRLHKLIKDTMNEEAERDGRLRRLIADEVDKEQGERQLQRWSAYLVATNCVSFVVDGIAESLCSSLSVWCGVFPASC